MNTRAEQPEEPVEHPTREPAEFPEARAAAAATRTEEHQADAHDEMPRIRVSRRTLLVAGLFVGSALAFLYFVLPKLVGLQDAWNRIKDGNGWWLGAAAVLEILSFLGYIVLFRGVFVRGRSRIGWRESYQITMAGLVATRLFATAGAGGIALTAWALRRSGMPARIAACRLIAFNVILYGVFMATLVLDGLALYLGIFSGSAPFAITIVPGMLGAVAIVLFLSFTSLPEDLERRVAGWTRPGTRFAQVATRVAAAPVALASGVRTAIGLVREREPMLLGAPAWWGFDIAVLWACFHAFGASPPVGVIVMAYFVGMFGNTLPLPGGIGGVDGGMIGAFAAFGVDAEASIVAVLAYRGFSFWLPTIPGAVAYLQLRRTVHRWQREPAPVPAIRG